MASDSKNSDSHRSSDTEAAIILLRAKCIIWKRIFEQYPGSERARRRLFDSVIAAFFEPAMASQAYVDLWRFKSERREESVKCPYRLLLLPSDLALLDSCGWSPGLHWAINKVRLWLWELMQNDTSAHRAVQVLVETNCHFHPPKESIARNEAGSKRRSRRENGGLIQCPPNLSLPLSDWYLLWLIGDEGAMQAALGGVSLKEHVLRLYVALCDDSEPPHGVLALPPLR